MSNVYFAGIPTDIEVRQLEETWPDESLTVGTVIAYSDIAELIKTKTEDSRFRTVTGRWRRNVERRTGKIIGPDKPGETLRVYDDKDKLDLSKTKLKTASRFARRSRIVAANVEAKNLTEQQKKELEHTINTSATILQASRLKSQVQLPQI